MKAIYSPEILAQIKRNQNALGRYEQDLLKQLNINPDRFDSYSEALKRTFLYDTRRLKLSADRDKFIATQMPIAFAEEKSINNLSEVKEALKLAASLVLTRKQDTTIDGESFATTDINLINQLDSKLAQILTNDKDINFDNIDNAIQAISELK